MRVLLLALALCTTLAAPVHAGTEPPTSGCDAVPLLQTQDEPTPVGTGPCEGIRPGGRVRTPTSWCSLNFAFQGSDGSRYIGTAGHCLFKDDDERVWAPGTGPPAWDWAFSRVGEWAYSVQDSFGDRDFALIRLFDGVEVDPEMCHFGGPTGIYEGLESQPVLMRHYGNGIHVSDVTPARSAVAPDTRNPDYVASHGVAAWGDSGSGIMTADGLAVGVVVHLRFDPVGGTMGSTRLPPQLERAEDLLGISLKLMTAPLAGDG